LGRINLQRIDDVVTIYVHFFRSLYVNIDVLWKRSASCKRKTSTSSASARS